MMGWLAVLSCARLIGSMESHAVGRAGVVDGAVRAAP